MQEWVVLVQTVGFPIFMAIWLMRTLDKRLTRIENLMLEQLKLNASIVRTLDIPDDELQKSLSPCKEQ